MTSVILAILTHLLSTWPANPANAEKVSLSENIVRLSEKYGVDPVLLTVMGYQESSMRRDLKGALGEVGMYQVHGKSKGACIAEKIDPRGVECGAFLIDMNTRFCGSVERGLYRYMSGSCRGTPRAKRKAAHRLKKAERLRRMFGDGAT